LYHAALILAGAAVLALYAVQIVLALAGVPTLIAVGASMVAAIAFVAVGERHAPGLAGVRITAPRYFAAAVMIGVSLWLLSALVVRLVWPEPPTSRLEHLVTASPMLPTLLVGAVLPGIAEELVFRGVLARALARRFGPALAIFASAAAFALYHLNPPQMPPAFVLGSALGFIAVRADSALPTMISHAANNAIAIVLVREPGFARVLASHPAPTFAACGLLLALGLVLVALPSRPPEGPRSEARDIVEP
jgi:membrane protease YdiL (CAAX protease family)